MSRPAVTRRRNGTHLVGRLGTAEGEQEHGVVGGEGVVAACLA